MTLRDYQENFVKGLGTKLAQGKRKIVGQLATGGGKTVVFTAISKRYLEKSGKKVLILVHRKELLQQTRKTVYNLAGLVCQPIKAGMKFIPDADIYVGMIESVNRRIDQLKAKGIGLLINDECHIASFNKILEHFEEQFIIGFTATPLSSSKKRPVNMFYDDIVCGVDIPQLIADGHLCQNITWAPKDTVDRLELAVKGNDFDEAKMGEAFSRPKYITNTVTAYGKWAKGTKTIIFNVNIFHSQEVTKAFIDAGYNCRHLDGETSPAERTEILAWFATTPDAILCNVGIATTGFDEPTIETVIVNKATLSMPLWLQMCGRGSRPTPTKSAFTIIDMGGNAIVHGDWNQSRNWIDIFFNPPKPGKSTAAPVKSCPECDAIVAASLRVCPYCGYEWAAKDIPIEHDLHDFIVVTKGIDVQEIMEANRHRKNYFSFFEIGRQLAEEAKKTIPEMTDEYAVYILNRYFELAREWCKANKKNLSVWYRAKAQECLYEHLKKAYKKWNPPTEVHRLKGDIVAAERLNHLPANFALPTLEPLKKIV